MRAPTVVRPGGGWTLAAALLVAFIGCTALQVARYGTQGLGLFVGCFVLGAILYYLVRVRSRVRVTPTTVTVRGYLRSRTFPRFAIDRIVVQPSDPWWQTRPSARPRFIASMIATDASTLFELRQGAWTRSDMDRIGAAIGVRVSDDPRDNTD